MKWQLAALLVAAAIQPAMAVSRSHATVASFKRAYPCPSTGDSRGPCPGYVVDHVVPLCAGGPDVTSNMQWQAAADAKAKDKQEWAQCRALKKQSAPGATPGNLTQGELWTQVVHSLA